jgi:carbonic anhydrase/acetyltransferase-like protein (isoleucine patch superfamily)
VIHKCGEFYIADNAVITGDVVIGPETSIWYHTVIRGDVAPIRIGARVNIQDACLVHCRHDTPLEIGDDVTIGHHAVIHGKRIGAGSLIGIGACLLDNVEVGECCIIAPAAIVTPGTIIPDGSVVMGLPAAVVRGVNDQDRAYLNFARDAYLRLSKAYAAGEINQLWPPMRGGISDASL